MDARLRILERRARLGDKDAQLALTVSSKRIYDPSEKVQELYAEILSFEPEPSLSDVLKNIFNYVLFDLRMANCRLHGIIKGTLTSRRQYNRVREYLYSAANALETNFKNEQFTKQVEQVLDVIRRMREVYQELRNLYDATSDVKKRQRKALRKKLKT